MENHHQNHQETQTLNRRELLKALGAAGGALATSAFLPGSWSKPAIEAGNLPAHALQTVALVIDDLMVCTQFDPAIGNDLYTHHVGFWYHDYAHMMDENARVFVWVEGCGPLPFSGKAIKDLPNGNVTGFQDPPWDEGGVSFDIDWPCKSQGPLCVRLAVGPRWSNTECGYPDECGV